MADALAPKAEEGRGWLRKAARSRQQALYARISEWGNPLQDMLEDLGVEFIDAQEGTGGTETSQYLEERKPFP